MDDHEVLDEVTKSCGGFLELFIICFLIIGQHYSKQLNDLSNIHNFSLRLSTYLIKQIFNQFLSFIFLYEYIEKGWIVN